MNQRQTNQANRQKLIVKNAARFFSSIGYDLTAIEMVAERSNVSPATIYNNFDNKSQEYSSIIKIKKSYYMFYNGNDYGKEGVGLAIFDEKK